MAKGRTAPALALAIVPLLAALPFVSRHVGPGPGPQPAQQHGAVGGARAGLGAPRRAADPDPKILLGRYMVLTHACGGCHGGGDDNPNAPGWLAGEPTPDDQFLIGPCATQPGAQPCFHTHPRNLTPDVETGLGRFTERQIFNALRYGLRPEDTPDVTITSTTPGKGNFPLHPHYLAPPMPWPSWRHMHDQDLWAIAAYLKRGVKPVNHKVAESEGPPDFWAAAYAGAIPQVKIGTYPAPPFPTANETGGEQAMGAKSQ